MLGKFVDVKNIQEYKDLEDKYNKLTKDFIALTKESKDHINRADQLENENLRLKTNANPGVEKVIIKRMESKIDSSINVLISIANFLIKNKKTIQDKKQQYIYSTSENFREAFSAVTNITEETDQNVYLRIFRGLEFIDTDERRFNKRKKFEGKIKRVFAIDRKKLKILIELLEDD